MTKILIIAALLINISLALVDKATGNRLKSRESVLPFSFVKTLLCCSLAAVFLPFVKLNINADGVWVALLAGLFHALSVVLIMHALRRSPAVYVNLFMASGIVLPTLFDWIFIYNGVRFSEFLLLAGVLLSLSLVLNLKREKASLGLLLFMFFCYGMLMVMQGAFPKVCPNGSKLLFSVIMYGSSAVLLGAVCLFKRSHVTVTPALGGLCIGAAAFNLAINILLTTLSALIPSAVVFPAVHGLKLVAVTLLSSVLWNERLTQTQIVGSFLTIIFICIIGG